MIIENFGFIAALLVLIGITIGAVLAYLTLRTKQASRITLRLIECNESTKFDAIQFLEIAWPILQKAGFTGFKWHAQWYGGERWGESGDNSSYAISRVIEATDIQLTIALRLPGHRGEDRYFHTAIAETFFLLLQCDIWVKTGSVTAATTQLSRFSLFLRHDMKNFAQYLELLDDQVKACPPGKEEQLLVRLQRSTPILRDRAQRLLRALQGQGSESNSEEAIDLQTLIRETAALHGLDINVSGAATLHFVRAPLENALDNLFKNYADLARMQRRPPTQLSAVLAHSAAGELSISIHDPDATPVAQPERLFEPFWSDSPGGLGIGLYQAKQTLAKLDVSLSASQLEGAPPVFHFVFPPGFHDV